MIDLHTEDPEKQWKQSVEDEIMALKLKQRVLENRRGGARVSASHWRQIALNAIDAFKNFSQEFRPTGGIRNILITASNALIDNNTALADINRNLDYIHMTQMHQAGLGRLSFDKENGRLVFDFYESSASDQEPQEMRQAGTTKPHKGTNAWEFIPPAPYTGVVIVCAADEAASLGMRCHAEVKAPGGVRQRFPIEFIDSPF